MSHGSMVKKLFWPFVQRPALAATSCFHATALSEYEDIRRIGFAQPVAVIPNGIDIPEIVPTPQREIKTLLFLGRIHPKKGLPLLLRSWQGISRRFLDWRLKIVGPDNAGHLRQIQALAAALRLQRVSFEGALYGARKLAAYQDADLFVLPTHSENFAVSVAEALAAGVPAIVSRGAPWREIEARRAGWWPEASVDALSEALTTAMELSPAERRAMGMRGRLWMREEYSWSRVGSMMSETYRWIRGESPLPAWVRLD
jgi:glycosyltransferase involved in cell wall biosynthesis